MTPKTAIEVLAEVGYEGFVKALYNRSGDLSKDFTHAVLGIVTECHEYLTATDQVNAIEEAGDLCFYLTALTQVLQAVGAFDEGEFDRLTEEAVVRMDAEGFQIMDEFVEWLDLAKRWVGYGKAPTMSHTQLMAEAAALVSFVIDKGAAANVGMPVVMVTNVDKLLKRYNGMAFNAERAVNRDLPAERAVLESHAV